MKADIMRVVNVVIKACRSYRDLNFIDDVIAHVVDGVTFGEDEIREAEQEDAE